MRLCISWILRKARSSALEPYHPALVFYRHFSYFQPSKFDSRSQVFLCHPFPAYSVNKGMPSNSAMFNPFISPQEWADWCTRVCCSVEIRTRLEKLLWLVSSLLELSSLFLCHQIFSHEAVVWEFGVIFVFICMLHVVWFHQLFIRSRISGQSNHWSLNVL